MGASSAPARAFEVVVAGGGVAALEACLALRDYAGERVAITLLAPDADFVARAERVREPFGAARAARYSLDAIAADLGLRRCVDRFTWVERTARIVHTQGGEAIGYDALLLAVGARMSPAFSHALTIDDARLDEQLQALIGEVDAGYVSSLAFVAPDTVAWPLPMYELALLLAARAREVRTALSITIATPEDAPLAVFGAPASRRLGELLDASGILVVTSARCAVPEPGRVTVRPGARALHVDRVIALPELFGPATPGLPGGAPRGFIAVDPHGAVRGVDRVYAAGDAVAFPVKHGTIAAAQAEAAAEAIAVLAGAREHARPVVPVLRAMLLGGDEPLFLSAVVTGSHGSRSRVQSSADWPSKAKLAAPRLARYLEALDQRGAGHAATVGVSSAT